ncbi:TetR/AcrR family transcriptional regulator [Bacillus daqingensis]|uniref:TetR/AcrR family transcriptional regulator n=1 Tax=Bacillus daqingensis TaxID=872396 RepID=A0ABV9NZ28_9BACI
MPRRPKPEETKQTLLDHFWQIYCDKPIDRITVREITDAAGFNRGTFYVYFTDVYDALRTIEEAIIPDEAEFEQMMKLHHEGIDFYTSMEHFTSFYETHGDKLRVLLGPNGDPTFAHRLKDRMRHYLLYYSASELAGLSAQDRLKMEYIVEAEMASRLGMLTLWFSRGKDLTLEQFHQLTYSLTRNGSLRTSAELYDKSKNQDS